jgi:glutathione S-transferase
MYELYGMPRSRSTRVSWTLEELGVEYRFHLINLMKGEGQSAEFLKLNPYGKLPVMVDGDLVLTESAAICTYLGDQHPEAELVPRPGTAERGKYDQWCYFILSELEQPLWSIHKHRFVFPPEKQVPQMLEVAPWEFQRALDVLIKGLGQQEYLVGNSFSLADILLTHTLTWAKALKMSIDNPELGNYIQRISSRTALERARLREKSGK